MKILDDLESKAKAATPGPWIIQERRVPLGKCIETIDESILKMDEDELVACAEYSSEDAKYIASVSPDVVLKLLAVVKAAKDSENKFMAINDGFFTGLVPPEFGPVSISLRALEQGKDE